MAGIEESRKKLVDGMPGHYDREIGKHQKGAYYQAGVEYLRERLVAHFQTMKMHDAVIEHMKTALSGGEYSQFGSQSKRANEALAKRMKEPGVAEAVRAAIDELQKITTLHNQVMLQKPRARDMFANPLVGLRAELVDLQ